jgi:hypothetical protein
MPSLSLDDGKSQWLNHDMTETTPISYHRGTQLNAKLIVFRSSHFFHFSLLGDSNSTTPIKHLQALNRPLYLPPALHCYNKGNSSVSITAGRTSRFCHHVGITSSSRSNTALPFQESHPQLLLLLHCKHLLVFLIFLVLKILRRNHFLPKGGLLIWVLVRKTSKNPSFMSPNNKTITIRTIKGFTKESKDGAHIKMKSEEWQQVLGAIKGLKDNRNQLNAKVASLTQPGKKEIDGEQ